MLKNPFRRRTQRRDPVKEASQEALQFMHAAKMHIDQRDLTIPRKHLLFYVYAYGVITGIGDETGMDETQALAALLLVLKGMSGLSDPDISNMIGKCMQKAGDAEGSAFVSRGREAIEAWKGGDRSAAKALAVQLRDVP